MAGTSKGSPASASHVNPHESLSGLARFFADGLKNQAIDQGLKKIPGDVWKEVAGVKEAGTPRRGDLQAGKELDLRSGPKTSEKQPQIDKAKRSDILGGIDYRREVVQGVQMQRSHEQSEMDQKLNEIMNELRRLVKSSTVISNEYASIAVGTGPVKAGKYDINFFDFMISVIRTARQKVEDSGAWLQVSKKKNGYQQKAQSMGTKFTLSQERSTATQTG